MKNVSIEDCRLIEIGKISTKGGNLAIAEKNLPFSINRVFYLYDIPAGENRGAHAHIECHQLLIAACGSFDVLLEDGNSKKTVFLNRPSVGLHIPPGIWAEEINFSGSSICLVFASEKYNEQDYIREYSKYLSYGI